MGCCLKKVALLGIVFPETLPIGQVPLPYAVNQWVSTSPRQMTDQENQFASHLLRSFSGAFSRFHFHLDLDFNRNLRHF